MPECPCVLLRVPQCRLEPSRPSRADPKLPAKTSEHQKQWGLYNSLRVPSGCSSTPRSPRTAFAKVYFSCIQGKYTFSWSPPTPSSAAQSATVALSDTHHGASGVRRRRYATARAQRKNAASLAARSASKHILVYTTLFIMSSNRAPTRSGRLRWLRAKKKKKKERKKPFPAHVSSVAPQEPCMWATASTAACAQRLRPSRQAREGKKKNANACCAAAA